MPFWLHKPLALRYFLFSTRLQKLMIFGGISLLPAALWFCIFALPGYIKLVKKTYEHRELIKQKVEFEKKLYQRKQLKAKHAALTAQLNALNNSCRSAQRVVSVLLGIMRSAHISCRSIQPLGVKAHGKVLDHSLMVHGKARYHQLLEFIDACNNTLPAVRMTALTITKTTESVCEFSVTVVFAAARGQA